jgi:hypothetical protein
VLPSYSGITPLRTALAMAGFLPMTTMGVGDMVRGEVENEGRKERLERVGEKIGRIERRLRSTNMRDGSVPLSNYTSCT